MTEIYLQISRQKCIVVFTKFLQDYVSCTACFCGQRFEHVELNFRNTYEGKCYVQCLFGLRDVVCSFRSNRFRMQTFLPWNSSNNDSRPSDGSSLFSLNSKRTEQNGTFNSGSSITSQGIFRIYNQNKRRKSGEKSLRNCPKKFSNVTEERE